MIMSAFVLHGRNIVQFLLELAAYAHSDQYSPFSVPEETTHIREHFQAGSAQARLWLMRARESSDVHHRIPTERRRII